MRTKDFYFDLPDSAIAQTPLLKRDTSKLMVLQRSTDQIEHRHFNDILDYLQPGDCLVLNDTKVLPARIYGQRSSGAKVEFLLLSQTEKDHWKCLVKPGKKAKVGDAFSFDGVGMTARVVAILEDGIRLVKFDYDGVFEAILEQIGAMPLPPYIHEHLEDQDRYQTIYHRHLGSAAAPTAGLHFTKALLKQIADKGVAIAYVTLHVGLGTFRPVKASDIKEHQMHAEWYRLDQANAQLIATTKVSGGRVISVGTTSTRTLESIYQKHDKVVADSDWTNIFIHPGYQFGVIDALITNFHLPESTLLMLVSAFYQREQVLAAYQTAVEHDYRFFSFGDAMLIL